jgi:hypothetical protein
LLRLSEDRESVAYEKAMESVKMFWRLGAHGAASTVRKYLQEYPMMEELLGLEGDSFCTEIRPV